jgi:hypothetical protein
VESALPPAMLSKNGPPGWVKAVQRCQSAPTESNLQHL